jgi:hypothetical protein
MADYQPVTSIALDSSSLRLSGPKAGTVSTGISNAKYPSNSLLPIERSMMD